MGNMQNLGFEGGWGGSEKVVDLFSRRPRKEALKCSLGEQGLVRNAPAVPE